MLLFELKKTFMKGLKIGIDLNDLDTLFFSPKYFIDFGNRLESVIDNHRNALDKIKQNLNSNINRKSLPSNVIMTEEFVKCGKESCNKCRHGPYYYGYWRDKNGKLKKKYIGISK
jgi:hypothetical protein